MAHGVAAAWRRVWLLHGAGHGCCMALMRCHTDCQCPKSTVPLRMKPCCAAMQPPCCAAMQPPCCVTMQPPCCAAMQPPCRAAIMQDPQIHHVAPLSCKIRGSADPPCCADAMRDPRIRRSAMLRRHHARSEDQQIPTSELIGRTNCTHARTEDTERSVAWSPQPGDKHSLA